MSNAIVVEHTSAAASPVAAAAAAPSSSSSSSSPTRPPGASSTAGMTAILANILSLEEIDTNVYRGVSPAYPRFARIFGGQTIAQSLAAAGRTVDSAYRVHSLHAYFLRPGNDEWPVIYTVDVLRDGKGFASRRVIARQKGKPIFAMSASFHRREPGLAHQFRIPVAPPPDTLLTMLQEAQKVKDDARIAPRMKEQMLKQATVPFPIDIRRVTPRHFSDLLDKHAPRQQMWMRVAGKLNNDVLLHQCALAYMSDWSLLDTAMLPHAVRWYDAKRRPKIRQIASIDHCMWFHSDFRADSWLLYDMESPRAVNARGLSFGRFYDERGELVVSTAQEGLVRIGEEWMRTIFEEERNRETGTVERVWKMAGEEEGRWYEILQDPMLSENKNNPRKTAAVEEEYSEEPPVAEGQKPTASQKRIAAKL